MNLFQASHAAAAGTSTPSSQPIQLSECRPNGVGNTTCAPSQLKNQMNAVHAQITTSSAPAAAMRRAENRGLRGQNDPPQVISVSVSSGVGAMTDVSSGETSFTSTT